ncbi:hypothetical protein BH10PAT3_BH10PAT3_0500 [soil metagenome]
MSELRQIRALIVEDDEFKTEEIADALFYLGHAVVASASCAWDVKTLCERGEVSPTLVDVAFIDSNLGHGMGGGKEVLRYLFMQGFVRRPIGMNEDCVPVIADATKIVTVGASTEEDWSREIGSYSDRLEVPLVVNWAERPLGLAKVISEVSTLKPQI